ncbi:MAG: (2Fe-2S)-binding protein [Caldilineaceae bacterium]
MAQPLELHVNGRTVAVEVDPAAPLVYVLRNDLGLKSPKVGCNQEQCYACAVLVDGAAVPSCQLPVQQVAGLEITTVEGLGDAAAPHPLQEAFMEEQALQCGYCTAGMIMAAQGLLNRQRYPSDDDIREGLATNLCRCGVYERVRRAVKLRIGRPSAAPIYTVLTPDPLPPEWTPPPRPELSPSLPPIRNWTTGFASTPVMTTAWAPSPSSPARWRSARGCARPSPRSRPRSWTWSWRASAWWTATPRRRRTKASPQAASPWRRRDGGASGRAEAAIISWRWPMKRWKRPARARADGRRRWSPTR